MIITSKGIVYKNGDIMDFAMTSFNKHHLTNYCVFQPLKAFKGPIQFWTDFQSAEILQPLRKIGI